MKRIELKPFFFIVFFLIGLGLFGPTNLWAQEKSSLYLGVGLGIASQPEEKELEKAGLPTDIHLDWEMVRFGYTTYKAQKSLGLYKYTWDLLLETEAFYGAWKTPLSEGDESLYALLGIGYYVSELQLGNGVGPQKTQDFGFLVGVGTSGEIAGVKIGGALIQHSVTSVFNDIELAAGSAQLQFTVEVGL